MQSEVASINVKYADCYKIVMHTYMYSERLLWGKNHQANTS